MEISDEKNFSYKNLVLNIVWISFSLLGLIIIGYFIWQLNSEYTIEFNIEKSKRTTELSLGQKKKILIGFALAANTKALIMDEPTNGLDIPSKILFRNMINDSFKKDRIVIITSHQVRDLDELIHSIIIINDGNVLLNSDKDHIAKHLEFQLTDTPQNTSDLIYQEKVSNGFASFKENKTHTVGYIDMELLFNAVLTDASKINTLLNSRCAFRKNSVSSSEFNDCKA